MLSRPSKLAPVLMLTMIPNRLLRMCGRTALVSLYGPKKTVSNCARTSPSVMNSAAWRWAKAALLTSTSTATPCASRSSKTLALSGSSRSSGTHIPPLDSTSRTSSGVLDGLRDVAITLCPFAWACRAMARPKPEEQPVMSHVRGRAGVVKLNPSVAMVGVTILRLDVKRIDQPKYNQICILYLQGREMKN